MAQLPWQLSEIERLLEAHSKERLSLKSKLERGDLPPTKLRRMHERLNQLDEILRQLDYERAVRFSSVVKLNELISART